MLLRPMPTRPCPHCQRPARYLKDSSANSLVEYYRCDHCKDVWVVDPKDPDKPLRLVTLPRDPTHSKP